MRFFQTSARTLPHFFYISVFTFFYIIAKIYIGVHNNTIRFKVH